MKALYADMGYKIGRYKAVSLDKQNSIICGRKGWIFLTSKGSRIGVALLSGRLEKTEKIKYYDFSYLETAIEVLPMGLAVVYANNPELRYEKT